MSDPRHIVVLNLQKILQGRSLDTVLAETSYEFPDRDRALVAELTYGVCRWYAQLQAIIDARLSKPLRKKDQDVALVLILGAYQLLYSRVPAHAVISTSVDLTRKLDKGWASKLVNAILRGIQRDLKQKPEVVQKIQQRDLATEYAQPAWLVNLLRKSWPQDHQSLLNALQQRAPMTLRLNLRRASTEQYLARFQEKAISAQAHPLVPGAIELQKPLPIEQIPGFPEGLVSVQDAGAQLAGWLLDVFPGQRILDACAAPGGKTGHILELADDLHVTAVDVDAKRLARVTDNLQRLNLSAELQAADASKPPTEWLETPFDRILLDAPCSATGVIRRHPDIRLLRRAGDIPALAKRQTALLEALWPCLKPGGKLLYVTCSLLDEENVARIQHFLAKQTDARLTAMPQVLKQAEWGQARSFGRQTLPGELGMDGFYYALLEKARD